MISCRTYSYPLFAPSSDPPLLVASCCTTDGGTKTARVIRRKVASEIRILKKDSETIPKLLTRLNSYLDEAKNVRFGCAIYKAQG